MKGWVGGWAVRLSEKEMRSFVSNKHSALLKKRGKEGVTLYLNLGSHRSEEVAWLE